MTISDITSSTGDAAAFTPTSGRTATLESQTYALDLTFAPTEAKTYGATVSVRVSERCPMQVVRLEGKGVDAVLSWAPNPLDFGYLTPGVERVLPLTFTNVGSVPVQVSNLEPSSNEYRVRTAQPIMVPAAGTAVVEIAMKPTLLGPRNKSLDFATDLPTQPTGTALLKGYGGGPDIDATAAVDFGRVAYFAGASPPGQVTGKLTIKNVGTKPTPSDPKGNLRLAPGGLYWAVRVDASVPGNTASVDELCVGEVVAGVCANAPAAGSYDPAVGLEATAGKALLDVPLRVTPSAAGTKDWEVVIYSNDPDEPSAVVAVHAEAVVLSPCVYSVTPASLGFGVITPPNHRELAVTFRNASVVPGMDCLVHASVANSVPGLFALAGAAATPIAVGPGQAVELVIRAQPTANVATHTQATGALVLSVSNPTSPSVAVPLDATIGPSCLLVSDSSYDFGTVQVGCSSGTRSLEVYNACSTPLNIVSSTIIEGGGVFSIPSPLEGGVSIAPDSTAQSIGIRYAPSAVGSDRGAVAFEVTEAGVGRTYVIGLRGKGDNLGSNTERFNATSPAPADVLFVIDEDLYGYERNLQDNAAVMLSAAQVPLLDGHLGVVNMFENKGKLLGDGFNPRVLTSQTPDLVGQLKKKFWTSGNGSSTEESFAPALAALTAPFVNAENSGFLREDATLGIIAVTRSGDQSPLPVTHYHRRLRSLKGAQQAQSFSFSTIGPSSASAPAGCSYDTAGGDPRAAQMAQLTGGRFEDICPSDWTAVLSRVARVAFGHRTGFALKAIPDLTAGKTIAVKVAGVDVPANGAGGTAWTFDVIANAVQFEPLFVPPRSDAVSVTYSVACFP